MTLISDPPRPRHIYIAEWIDHLRADRMSLPIAPGDVRRDLVDLQARRAILLCAPHGCDYSDDEPARRWFAPWRTDRRCVACGMREHWTPGSQP